MTPLLALALVPILIAASVYLVWQWREFSMRDAAEKRIRDLAPLSNGRKPR